MSTIAKKNILGMILASLVYTACSKTDFGTGSSGGMSDSKDNGKNKGSVNPATSPNNSDTFADPSTDKILDGSGLLTEEGKAILRQKCWFAVSGGAIGTHAYNGQFPVPFGDGIIKTGAEFDDAGGVYLVARKAPYDYYSKTETFIKKAVDSTFDTIAVAPGMHVVIKTKNGRVLFEKDGPVIGISTYYSTAANNHKDLRAQVVKDLKSRSNLPKWMSEYFAANGDKLVSIALYSWTQNAQNFPVYDRYNPDHAATSVQVQAIPGSICDQEGVWE